MTKKEIKYEDAMKRLEEIVYEVENNKTDIDLIGENLKEAKALIKFCKEKLFKTEEDIDRILNSEEED
ncbi:MAG TPA: exodeoxyribonuclease VII small subunit [Bacteroidaceae bacterium]|nr:exodeoxyribonuclease VII small subunit [Bacteroidaceae bacterium]